MAEQEIAALSDLSNSLFIGKNKPFNPFYFYNQFIGFIFTLKIKNNEAGRYHPKRKSIRLQPGI